MKFLSRTGLKVAATALGIYILYRTAAYISWADLLELFQRGGFLLCLPILVYPAACTFHVLGLRKLFAEPTRSAMGFGPLYSVRMSGDALNKMTPFVDIGGEPLKAILFSQRKLASLDEAITAVWVSRVGFVLSEILFVVLGLCLLQWRYPSEPIRGFVLIGLSISLVYLAILVTAQMRGAIHAAPAITRYFEIQEQDSEAAQTLWNRADKALRSFYRTRKSDFFISLVWQFTGWVSSLFEVFIFFRVLGLEISILQAFIFQSLLQVLKTATFFIPGNIGTQEGGLAYLAAHLGFSPVDGFALSLIKRFRQFVWVLFGLFLWKINRRQHS